MVIATLPQDIPAANGCRGLVPTMGALHDGHASLMHHIRPLADQVVTSIFVNPTQFRPGEDFERYPRTPEADLELCEKAGVDCIFMPAVEVMYPLGQTSVNIHVDLVGDQWEGADRPGHFDGVATVVTKLFGFCRADLAVFAFKDLQQCAVIQRLTTSLGLGTKLVFAPTLREHDGLAMSSRNVYLSPEERAKAPQLYQTLQAIKKDLVSPSHHPVEAVISNHQATLDPSFEVSYLALVNRESMQSTSAEDKLAHVIIAAKLGKTRLIDNVALHD